VTPAQVSLWDRIIEAKEDATFSLPFVRNKYHLLDQACETLLQCHQKTNLMQGRHLRGLHANLTLYWNVMPIVGRLSTGQHTWKDALELPSDYSTAKPRQSRL
jgi:hypothetical protein